MVLAYGPKGYAKLSQLSGMGNRPGLGLALEQRGSDERNAAAELFRKRRREIRLECGVRATVGRTLTIDVPMAPPFAGSDLKIERQNHH
jgi:hypothetical protein